MNIFLVKRYKADDERNFELYLEQLGKLENQLIIEKITWKRKVYRTFT